MANRVHNSGPGWYCVRSLQKHEHIAAAHLAQLGEDLQVYCPRFRIRRRTRRGAVWFVEAVFPGYLFARFNWTDRIDEVRATPGVKGIVTFGEQVPMIAEEVVAGLKAEFGTESLRSVGDDPQPGEVVSVASGPLGGLSATVLCVLSSGDRIRVLLELLGQTVHAEVAREQIVMSRASARSVLAAGHPRQATRVEGESRRERPSEGQHLAGIN